MKSKKARILKIPFSTTLILSLALIVAWQVTAHAATTVTFGDNTGNDFPGTVEEALISERIGYTDYNYGGRSNFHVGDPADIARTRRSVIRFKDIAPNLPAGAVIISAEMYLYCNDSDGPTYHSIGAYRVLLNWREGDSNGVAEVDAVCWNDAQYTSLSWNTAGCDAASDVTAQDSTADRRATPEDSTLIPWTGQYFSWDLTTAVRNWHSGNWKEYGVILINDDEDTADCRKIFRSSENLTDGHRPYLSVTYDFTTPGSYTDSAHGHTTQGVNRSNVVTDPDHPDAYYVGACAHCHDVYNDSICGVNAFNLFAPVNYESQWDNFCFECHGGPSIQANMPNQYSYSVTVGEESPGCPENIEAAFMFVTEDGEPSTQCDSSVGSSHFLDDIRSFLAGMWGFDSDPANINACHGCHNPHMAKQDYPCSLPSDHENRVRQIWGDDSPGEKMADYVGSLDYQPPKTATGGYERGPLLQPDYVTFCTDCHMGVGEGGDWERGLHGTRPSCLNPPTYRKDPYKTSDNYVLCCTDCHEPHGSRNENLFRTEINGVTGIEVNLPGHWTALCGACHEWLHHTGEDCSGCHYHGGSYF